MNRNHLIAISVLLGIVLPVALARASEPPGGGKAAPANRPRASAVSDASGQSAKGSESARTTLEFDDLGGKRRRPLELGENKASVIIFVLHDCPISNKYAPEIQRLAAEFAPKKIPFYVVHVDPELSLDAARKHAKEFDYKLPVLIDRKHQLVRQLKATTAPEAFVVGEKGKVLYRGRIDDRYVSVGKPRQVVARQDLRLALESIVAGKSIEVAETKPIGCYIPDLDGE